MAFFKFHYVIVRPVVVEASDRASAQAYLGVGSDPWVVQIQSGGDGLLDGDYPAFVAKVEEIACPENTDEIDVLVNESGHGFLRPYETSLDGAFSEDDRC